MEAIIEQCISRMTYVKLTASGCQKLLLLLQLQQMGYVPDCMFLLDHHFVCMEASCEGFLFFTQCCWELAGGKESRHKKISSTHFCPHEEGKSNFSFRADVLSHNKLRSKSKRRVLPGNVLWRPANTGGLENSSGVACSIIKRCFTPIIIHESGSR